MFLHKSHATSRKGHNGDSRILPHNKNQKRHKLDRLYKMSGIAEQYSISY